MKSVFLRPARFATLLALATLICFSQGCKKKDDTPTPVTPAATGPTGKIMYASITSGSGTDNKATEYDLSTKTETQLVTVYDVTRMNNGKLLYVRQSGSHDEVGTANGDGTGSATLLTMPNSYYDVHNPKASNDNSRFAISNEDTYDTDVMPVMGTNAYNANGTILGSFQNLFGGSWTPDNRLVMTATYLDYWGDATEPAAGMQGLYISDAALTTVTPIANANVQHALFPSVSPDGSKVAFTMNDHIWVMDLSGANLHQLTTGSKAENYPVWSPDGNYIACICYGTFEVTYYNALAIVPVGATTEMKNDNASIWPLNPDLSGTSSNGRLNPMDGVLSWY